MFRVTKTFGHERGLSCCFRQHRAKSHCKFLHGYSIAVELGVVCTTLDENGWCYDFGKFKKIKDFLDCTFDHKLLIAEDDPELKAFTELDKRGVVDLIILPGVGCEAFAKHIFEKVGPDVNHSTGDRARLEYVTVKEHGSNSATYFPAYGL